MGIRVGFVIDPFSQINPKKDSTLAMINAAAARGWQCYVMFMNDLFVHNGASYGNVRTVKLQLDANPWYQLGETQTVPLAKFNAIFMRKDPPFNMEYVHATYILELAEAGGCLVVNKPQSLRDCNEKMIITHFPQCIPDTLVTREREQIIGFLSEYKDIILKPLDGMGGASIFRLREGDPNINVVIELLTQLGRRYIMVQRYLPAVTEGDKRILLINGEPIPYGLARIPAVGETRANLAAGGTGVGKALTEREHWLCEEIKPMLIAKGLIFVGIDVIGDYITEINVTSPTCIRELDKQFHLDIAGKLMDVVSEKLKSK
jgi:glutathione synthase